MVEYQKKENNSVGHQSMTVGAPSCYDLSNFLKPLPEKYLCPLDGGVLKEAVKSKKCKHAFGMQCILAYLIKEKEECPVCGISMNCGDLEPDDALRMSALKLNVHCREVNCTWTGTLEKESEHFNGPDCGVHLIECPFCERKLKKGNSFNAHKSVCPEAIVVCQDCYDDMPRKDYNMHKNGLGGRKCVISEPMKRQKQNLKRSSPQQALHQQVNLQSSDKNENMIFSHQMKMGMECRDEDICTLRHDFQKLKDQHIDLEKKHSQLQRTVDKLLHVVSALSVQSNCPTSTTGDLHQCRKNKNMVANKSTVNLSNCLHVTEINSNLSYPFSPSFLSPIKQDITSRVVNKKHEHDLRQWMLTPLKRKL